EQVAQLDFRQSQLGPDVLFRLDQVVVDGLHVEGPCPLGHLDADVSETDDAERLAHQLRALSGQLRPLAGHEAVVSVDDAARACNYPTDGVLGDDAGFGPGRADVRHGNAPLGGGVDVDVVVAVTRRLDEAEIPGGTDGRGVDVGERDEYRVGGR